MTSEPYAGRQSPYATFPAGPGASVNVATGNLNVSLPLFASRGVGLATGVGLVYNSLAPVGGSLGRGWQTNYDVVLTEHRVGDLSIRFGDGRTVFYRQSSVIGTDEDEYEAESNGFGFQGILQVGGSTPFTLRQKSGGLMRFDESGRLSQIVDANGNIETLTYASGLLTTVTDTAARDTSFGYDSSGRLNVVTDYATGTYSMTYANPTTPSDPEGLQSVLSTVTFDESNDVWSFTYHTANDASDGERENLLSGLKTPRGTAGDYGWTYFYYQDGRLADIHAPAEAHMTETGSESTFAAKRTIRYLDDSTAEVVGGRGNASGVEPDDYKTTISYWKADAEHILDADATTSTGNSIPPASN